ncbi:endolytic transglycosylase MltG [Actinomyces minihominis]|uniref:endolytic transglycosylase MltG n=1 Tax=Actinomyces minihominis TaxID=2002838 RepID=UPI001F5D656B|nr:endolytic transglycosylase MltG [Actinomyces minihominis]
MSSENPMAVPPKPSGSQFPTRRDLHRSRIPSRGEPHESQNDSKSEEPPATSVPPSTGVFPTRREHLIETGALPQVPARRAKKSQKAASKKFAAASPQTPPQAPPARTRRHDSGAVPVKNTVRVPAQRKAKKAPKWRVALILILLLGLVGGAVYVAWTTLGDSGTPTKESLDFPGPGEGEVEVTITTGDLGSDIARSLVDAGVVKTVAGFTQAFDGNSAASTIKPGTYTLKKGMTSAAALAWLLDEANRRDNAITVNAGQTAEQIFEKMISVGGFTQEQIDAALADPAALGLIEEADGNVEGWLATGSYEVANGDGPTELLSAMIERTKMELTELGAPEAEWQETLIKASILEREAGAYEDLPKVARVIANRLEMPEAETRGLLQMDSTVLYGVGKYGGLPTADDLASDSPFNTYRFPGLPPAPIASPSPEAIAATIDPADGDWLYFVTVNLDTGETLFSSTLEEQTENVKLLSQWCEENEGRC